MGLDGISRKMLQGAGMSPEEIARFLAGVRRDIVTRSIHWCFPA